jgi:glutamate synthase domain-containing protein 2
MTQSIDLEILNKLNKITEDIGAIKTDVAVIKARLDSQQKAIDKIPDLAEKVGELKNWRQIAVIIITGTASTVFGWILKSGRM